MLKNGQTYISAHTARFLKYVWQFFDIMYERVKPAYKYTNKT